MTAANTMDMLQRVATEIMTVRDDVLGEDPYLAESLLRWHDDLLLAIKANNGPKNPILQPKALEISSEMETWTSQSIRNARVAAGMSRSELADKADVSVAALKRIEDGVTETPRQSTLDKINKALRK